MQLNSPDVGAEKTTASQPPQHRSEPASSSGFVEERQELEWVLKHPELSRSASLVRFLSFICERYFEGEAGEIREYSIAVEALGRKAASFDSHADPIVRVTARALRKKLRDIYKNEGQDRPLQIVLPLGHYVPQFVRPSLAGETAAEQAAGATEAAETDAAPARKAWQRLAASRGKIARWAVALLGVAAVFVAGYYFGQHTPARLQPVNQSFQWGDPVWSDEFNGAAHELPDPAKWTYDVGNQGGWGNKEIEIYCSPQGAGNPRECDPKRPNAFQDGAGHLVLRAERTPDGSWTSARITTRGLKDFQYGRIEARMKLPVGSGLWPSFWMLGSDFPTVGWPASGSVDVVENVSYPAGSNGLGPQIIRSTIHGPHYYGANGPWHDYKFPNGGRVDDGNFHTYGIIWSPGMIQFYVDDPNNVFFVEDANDIPEGGSWVFDHPFFLVLNLAVGGDWPGNPDKTTPNPADVLVDYVRAYKIPHVPAPSIQWQPVEVKAGSAVASVITLQARGYSGHVHLSCSTEPATVACSLGISVVNLSDTLTQQDTLTLSTDSFTDTGHSVAPPGRYKVTITATTMSGDHSQLVVPFEVKASE